MTTFNFPGILTRLLAACVLTITVSADEGITDLTRDVEDLMTDHQIAGVVMIMIDTTGVTSNIVLGVTNHTDKTPLTENHYIRLGSVSKMFLGMTALRLATAGKLTLDTPINRVVTPVPLTNPWSRPVTITHLLEHTAGLTDMTRPEWDSKQPLTLADAFRVDPASRQLKWPAGLHSSYSNSGAGIAAHVIEQKTKSPWESVVEREVFTPLGLTSATYQLNDSVRRDLITGYNTDGITEIPYWHMLYPAFGGINIRTREMARVLSLLLQQGKIDDQQFLKADDITRLSQATSTLAARAGLGYGYGFGLYHFNFRGFPLIGHGGDADGYLTQLTYSPALGKGYFVVMNAFNYEAMRALKNRLHRHLINGETPPSKPEAYTLDDTVRSDLIGRYLPVTYRFPRADPPDHHLEIFLQDGQLFTRYRGDIEALVPVSQTHFRRIYEPVATMAFIRYNGQRYLQSDEGNFRQL